jgi:hypothetical protein
MCARLYDFPNAEINVRSVRPGEGPHALVPTGRMRVTKKQSDGFNEQSAVFSGSRHFDKYP